MQKSMKHGNERKDAGGSVVDRINGVFEISGGFFVVLHILRALHDKSVGSVSIIAATFFTIWGFWNLYYYKAIQQKWSMRATYFITAMNTIWLLLLIHYGV